MQDRIVSSTSMMTYISIAIVFIIVAATLWFFFDSRNWVETTGVVDSIKLEEVYNAPISSMSENTKYTEYKIDLVYHYTVNNKNYTGTQFYPLIPNVFDEKSYALELINSYPQGASTSVFYNPSKPEQSCLITSKSISGKSYIYIVLVFLIIGLIFILGMKYFSHLFTD